MAENRITRVWWLVTICLLLVIAAGLGWRDVAASNAAATASSASAALAVGDTQTAVLDEQQAVNELEAQLIAVYEATSPSVVNITNRSTVYSPFMGVTPQKGTGSGFVYDTGGHILTNYHVIEGADELQVTLAGGQTYEADVVGSDPQNDLAILHIDAGADLPEPLTIGDSDSLHVGQFVLAIGNPFGLEQTLTTGVVSATGRVIESSADNEFIGEAIQTDAAINPGNSGGPLLDLQGRVIGINSQIISPSGASAGIGFAVSAKTVQRVVPELISEGSYAHPWLGVETVSLTPANVEALQQLGVDLGANSGVLVLEAVSNGPADRAGLRGGSEIVRAGRYRLPIGGDIITAVDGTPVADYQALTVYLETQTAVGDSVRVTVLRDGEELTLPVTLGEQP